MDKGCCIRFGIDGNAAEHLGAGWSRPEPGFTWTLGHQSTLLLPAPLAPTALSVSLRAHPFAPAARPFQRVTAPSATPCSPVCCSPSRTICAW
jgi:hypothetical protein